jgi:GxxExxY protein
MAITEDDPLTYSLIGFAMQTHSKFGPGLDEICYHEWLTSLMSAASIPNQYKPRFLLLHRGFTADQFEADIVVSDRVVVEAKHLRDQFAPKHFAQIHCYLKAWKTPTGLLFDFGKQSLILRRQIAPTNPPHFPSCHELDHQLRARGLNTPDAQLVAASLERILQTHGLGYWDTTYRGLVRADLLAEHLDLVERPEVIVDTGRTRARRVQLDCLIINNRLVLNVLALQESIPAAAQAMMATWLRQLRLHHGVTINFGKTQIALDVQQR